MAGASGGSPVGRCALKVDRLTGVPRPTLGRARAGSAVAAAALAAAGRHGSNLGRIQFSLTVQATGRPSTLGPADVDYLHGDAASSPGAIRRHRSRRRAAGTTTASGAGQRELAEDRSRVEA